MKLQLDGIEPIEGVRPIDFVCDECKAPKHRPCLSSLFMYSIQISEREAFANRLPAYHVLRVDAAFDHMSRALRVLAESVAANTTEIATLRETLGIAK